MSLLGNVLDSRAAMRQGVENLDPGFVAYTFYGIAAIGPTLAASALIYDADGNPATVPASAGDPAYLAYCSFNLPAGLVADAANRVLKLAAAATTAAGPAAASSAVSGASPFAYAAEAVRSASVPGSLTAITANATFALFSTDGSNVAAGTLGSALGTVYVDCEIIYLKRKPAIKSGESLRSKSQAYIAAGVASGSI